MRWIAEPGIFSGSYEFATVPGRDLFGSRGAPCKGFGPVKKSQDKVRQTTLECPAKGHGSDAPSFVRFATSVVSLKFVP